MVDISKFLCFTLTHQSTDNVIIIHHNKNVQHAQRAVYQQAHFYPRRSSSPSKSREIMSGLLRNCVLQLLIYFNVVTVNVQHVQQTWLISPLTSLVPAVYRQKGNDLNQDSFSSSTCWGATGGPHVEVTSVSHEWLLAFTNSPVTSYTVTLLLTNVNNEAVGNHQPLLFKLTAQENTRRRCRGFGATARGKSQRTNPIVMQFNRAAEAQSGPPNNRSETVSWSELAGPRATALSKQRAGKTSHFDSQLARKPPTQRMRP